MRKNKKVKKIAKKLVKRLIRNIIYLLVGFVYTIYLLIRGFDNLVVKLFMKLPRISRAVILWALVISNIYHNFDFRVLAKEVKYNTLKVVEPVKQTTTPTPEKTPQIEMEEEVGYSCTLEHETACKIQKKAVEYNIDWKIAVAISRWETGNFTSNLYKNKNNVGGLYCKGFLSYNSLDEGIEAFVRNLKRNYFDMGLNTLEKIQPKYCPIGAENDPTGLNNHWLAGVTQIYNSLEESK